MKFVHCADIHLDSPFTLSGLGEGEKRRTELQSTFASLLLETRLFGADVFIISGDLFEENYVTKNTMLLVAKELEKLPCNVYITPGNHDPYRIGSPYTLVRMPKNVHIFTSERLSFVDDEKCGARIYGYGYNSENPSLHPLSDFEGVEDDYAKPTILVAHAVLDDLHTPYAVITKDEIEKSHFDYIALGHVHTAESISTAGKTTYAFSCCLEGRDFGECGVGGAIFGEITSDGVKCHRRRFSKRHYEALKIDVSDFKNDLELCEKLTSLCHGYGNDTALRVTTNGIWSEGVSISQEKLRKIIPLPYYIELCDEASAPVDFSSLEADSGIKGAFYRKLKPKIESGDESERRVALLALKYGISAFDLSKK